MASDLGRQMWKAVAGRRSGEPAGNAADALREWKAAGLSNKEIAQQLGVTPRTVERWTTTTAGQRRDPAKSKHAGRIVEAANQDPKVRARALSRYRASRMRNRGARIRIKGTQGPAAGGRTYLRRRQITHEIEGAALARVMQAWGSGDDDAALAELRDALEDGGYPDWQWSDDATVDLLGHER